MSPEKLTGTERDAVYEKLRTQLMVYLTPKIKQKAEDVTQRTIILLLRDFKHLEGKPDLIYEGIAIARNLLFEEYRANSRALNRFEDLDKREIADGRHPGPHELLDDKQKREILHAAILGLKGRCRELMSMRLREMSTAEIAERLGMTPGHVHTMESRDCRPNLGRRLREFRSRRGKY